MLITPTKAQIESPANVGIIVGIYYIVIIIPLG